MNKNLFLSVTLMLAAASFTGCQNEDMGAMTQEGLTIVAEMGDKSRTALGVDDKTVTWSAGDRIYLFGDNSKATLNLVKGEGETTGTFSGHVYGFPSQLTTALYPVPTVNGATYSYEFPSERSWSENSAAPMIGDFANGQVQFQNLTALIRIPLSNLNGNQENVVKINMAGQTIVGTATVDVEGKAVSFEGSGNEVSVTIPAGVTECNVDFPIPAGTYTGYTISLNDKTMATKEGEMLVSPSDVLILVGDYINQKDYYEVYTAKGLLKWAYDVNEKDALELGLRIMADIEMPALTITVDEENETYVFTDEIITVEDGVSSGSNWIPVRGGISSLSEAYSGHIEGNNKTIKGLRVVENTDQVGFIGAMYDDASIQNLVIEDAVIKGGIETGAAIGRSHNGTLVKNVHVKNSTIKGKENVGGVAGLNYRRIKSGIDEKISIMENCTTDKDTQVLGTSSLVGGICGNNNGALVINCINNADVTGDALVGGICGQSREYNTGVNGYLIACGSTADATITATGKNGSAGGIVGWAVIDRANHGYDVESYVVACYSNSSISGYYKGTILGMNNNCVIRASWGEQKGATKIAGYTASQPTLYATYNFKDVDAVEQDAINEMNLAIAAYNKIEGVEVKCPYTWEIGADGWPILK